MNVDLLQDVYKKSLSENEKKMLFWENYVKDLEALDFTAFSEKLTVPILVPIGSRILFRGQLQHTNEINVSLGANYFAKCSANQAELLKQNRIKVAKAKLELLKKERDFFQNHISISKQAISDDAGYDIIEVATDEEDKNWRKLHRENVRKYKQKQNKNDGAIDEVPNEELWNRLQELELQEELENELTDNEDNKDNDDNEDEKKKLKKPPANSNRRTDNADSATDSDDSKGGNKVQQENVNGDQMKDANDFNEIYLAEFGTKTRIFQQPSKLHLFELVVDRHNALKKMVADMKARQQKCKTEGELERKLDDMEQLEQLEDEIAILEDMLASDDEDDEIDEVEDEDDTENQSRKVAFADEDESETFELTFTHSKVEPSKTPYDPQTGITKPSDIIKAYSNLKTETTSILKKPKCDVSPSPADNNPAVKEKERDEVQDSNANNAIVVKDVVEKVDANVSNVKQNKKPMSLFKKRRQQSKK